MRQTVTHKETKTHTHIERERERDPHVNPPTAVGLVPKYEISVVLPGDGWQAGGAGSTGFIIAILAEDDGDEGTTMNSA